MRKETANILKSERIFYLDFARGLAVFFMIMQHAMIIHERSGGEGNTIIGNIFIALGTAPAAPVFVFIMGIFLVKSKKTVKQNVIRGVKLFAFGYVLNLLRFTLPLLVTGISKSFAEDMFQMVTGSSHEIINYSFYLLFTVDIFQLAGLSLVFFSFFKKYANNRYMLPLLSIFILLISPYLWGLKDNLLIFTPLWGASEIIDFPLFPWSVYFLLGMYLSKYFQAEKMEKNMKKWLVIAGIILGVTGISTLGIFPIGDYYRSGLNIHFLMISFVFLWIVLCDYIVIKLNAKKLNRFLNIIYFWSSNVTGFYVFQWIIYGWSMLIIGSNRLVDYEAVGIGFIVVIITHMLLKYTKVKKLIPKL
nr:acyltransferase [uncultured Aminipila sp.]